MTEPQQPQRKATPLQVIVTGIIFAAIFVLSLVILVRTITS